MSATWSEFWNGGEISRFTEWFNGQVEEDSSLYSLRGNYMRAWKAAKEDALSVARQSDSRQSPEPAENRFDSDATDLAPEEVLAAYLSEERRMDDALRADSLQDTLDFNLAAKAAGGSL